MNLKEQSLAVIVYLKSKSQYIPARKVKKALESESGELKLKPFAGSYNHAIIIAAYSIVAGVIPFLEDENGYFTILTKDIGNNEPIAETETY